MLLKNACIFDFRESRKSITNHSFIVPLFGANNNSFWCYLLQKKVEKRIC